jgi:hypothetical protein
VLSRPLIAIDRTQPVRIAILIGLLTFISSYVLLSSRQMGGADFSWPLHGARLLLSGIDPYMTGGYPDARPLYYPLPALFVALPLVWLPDSLAAAVFFGASCGLLAWGLARSNAHQLLLFLSAPFVAAIMLAQWSPLLMAVYILPWLLPLAICKPNLGFMVLSRGRTPGWSAIIAVLIFGISLLVLPSWPVHWWHNTRQYAPAAPLLPCMRVLLLLAFLRWRDPAARLAGCFAFVPHQPYDLILLWLIPRSFRQSLVLTMTSWLAFFLWLATPRLFPIAFSVLLYLPALIFALWPKVRQFLARKPFNRLPMVTLVQD